MDNRYRFHEIIQAAERGEDLSQFKPKNAPEAVLLADLLTIANGGGSGGTCSGEVVLGESTVLKVDGKETISVLDFKELGIRIATMSPEQQQALIMYMIEKVPQNTANMLYSWRDEVLDSYKAVYLLNYDGYLSLSVGSVYPHSSESNLQSYGSKAVFRLNLSTFEVDGDDDIGQYLVYKSHDFSKEGQYHSSPMANLVVKGDINTTIEDSVPITYYTLNDYLFQNLGLGIKEIKCAGATTGGGSTDGVVAVKGQSSVRITKDFSDDLSETEQQDLGIQAIRNIIQEVINDGFKVFVNSPVISDGVITSWNKAYVSSTTELPVSLSGQNNGSWYYSIGASLNDFLTLLPMEYVVQFFQDFSRICFWGIEIPSNTVGKKYGSAGEKVYPTGSTYYLLLQLSASNMENVIGENNTIPIPNGYGIFIEEFN